MIKVTEAGEYHIKQIDELWLEFMRFHESIDPLFKPRESAIPGFEQEQRRLMGPEDGLVLAAMDKERVVGFALAELRGPHKAYHLDRYGAIDTVAVTQEYRRKGVGEQMVRRILDWFRENGIIRVELEVLARNQVSYSFWRKQGFNDYRHRLFTRI
jgi:GNAT superfamily N-acetyltransferase